VLRCGIYFPGRSASCHRVSTANKNRKRASVTGVLPLKTVPCVLRQHPDKAAHGRRHQRSADVDVWMLKNDGILVRAMSFKSLSGGNFTLTRIELSDINPSGFWGPSNFRISMLHRESARDSGNHRYALPPVYLRFRSAPTLGGGAWCRNPYV
jgi:hypothetical protein